ncbi:hypothetical protein [Altererythrobacter sp. Root672]|uniref:hypothetical protein n=1 Tax=Altererythrobacter sp. Root672 TaxID=1736584 RepID=UPI0006F9194D|nr:hypothetical protein [Altererythrobacter sp. Root672]KRA81639.1 hypothetical protein ASD76_14040 [Altererythrobacter sp. Root672]
MTDDQLSQLWAFSRGDLPARKFEEWLLAQNGLEEPIGEELHWALESGDYSNRDEVWKLRKSLALALGSQKECECPAIRDAAAIPMGGDFYFEKVFDTLDQLVEFGPEKWWLYISKCRCCATVWLIAQDDRIYDEFYFQRIDEAALADARLGHWPPQLQTYEDLLSTGRKLSNPPRFFDPMAGSLQWAVEDLLKERPTISTDEIGNLLGLSKEHAMALVGKVQSPLADHNH